jgi:uncharacterized protein YcfL
MKITLCLLVAALLITGCSSKQQVVMPTASIVAPTATLKSSEMGGSGGSGFELLKNPQNK